MYHNILAAIDGGEMGERVLSDAADLAQALNARLTILSVSPGVPPFAYGAGMDVRELERISVKETERIVQAARDQVPGDVGVTTIVRSGDPGQEIVTQINEGRHDLVVLGSRGRGRIASGVLGSVVGDVHFATRVPMLVIHPQDTED